MRVMGFRSRASRFAAIASAAMLAGACTWVKLTAPGEGVRVGTTAEVARCKKLGATHAITRAKIVFYSRSEETIEQELETLARNEAAEMRGNMIVPQGPTSSEGRRSFDVFSCR